MDRIIIMSIVLVTVYLDEDIPEYMNGVFRIGSVILEDDQGKETDHDGLVDNTDFHSLDNLKRTVADCLEVNNEIVVIGNN